MDIAIIGTGKMGRALGAAWRPHGHTITFGSRTPTAELLDGSPVLDIGSAAAAAEVVVFAFPWYALIDVVRAVDKLAGKIIIDCINPLTSSGSLALGHKWSAGEEIANTFPLAHVVKAFNGVHHEHIANPTFSGYSADVFYCSDWDAAKAAVAQLAAEMGFNPVDVGPIKQARYLEPLAALWIQVAFHLGRGPEFVFKLLPR